MGEFELIAKLLKPLAAGFPGALDLEDDAALVSLEAGLELVIAKDAIVAGVHFLPDDPADLVAGKLLRANLSDLAAMGSDPLAYLTAIVRPHAMADEDLEELGRGLARDQKRFGLHLLGGDTVSTEGPLVLSLTILGTVPQGRALRRRGAAPGDRLFVSGTLGDAAMGLRILRGLATSEDEALPLIDRYHTPQPRLALGRALRGVASAAIDVSDGLLADLGHVLEVSGVGAVVQADRLPRSDAAAGLPGSLEAALAGGDDYELLFTVPAERCDRMAEVGRLSQTAVTEIGHIVADRGLTLLDREGRSIQPRSAGWQHF
jgi:thiamine-monophosphate kinase